MQGPAKVILPDVLKESKLKLEDELAAILGISGQEVVDLAEMMAGYTDCMDEVVKYLTKEESFPDDHPFVVSLRAYLLLHRQKLLDSVLSQVS